MTAAVAASSLPSRLTAVRLSYRAEQVLIVAAVAFGSISAIISGAAPTGAALIDAGLITAAVVAVVLAAGTAPWWVVALAAVLASPFVTSPALLGVGMVAASLALLSGHRHGDESALRVVAMGLVAVMLFRLDVGPFGMSAIVASSMCLVVVAAGVVGMESELRGRLARAAAPFGVLIVGVFAAVAFQASGAARDISAARSLTDEAVVALGDGNVGIAADKLSAAADRFDAARRGLAHPLMQPAAFMPVVAQHRAVGIAVSAAAADVANEADAALTVLDGGALTVTAGKIDLTAVAALEAPVVELRVGLQSLNELTASFDSPWLVAPVRHTIANLGLELDRQLPHLERAVDVIRVMPDLLGADSPRRYLLLFTTPAEARAGGGFIGNYAEVVVDDGQIAVSSFRRRADLERGLATRGGTCTACSAELVREYGRFGFDVGTGAVASRVWSNLTMSAHFPDVAQAAAALYPQSGGRPVDGVVVLDPFVVAALMQFTGPVELPELGVVVDPDGAVDFIVRDQYVLVGDDGHEERIDGLAVLGARVIDDLLAGALPPADVLAETLAPFAGQRRLMAWLADDAEQALVESTELAGALPAPAPADFAFTTNNAAGNKIDAFAQSDVRFEVAQVGGTSHLIVDVDLTNEAPATGLPQYVIGNEVGLPPGYSRTLVTFYGPDVLVEATLDGTDLALERGSEAGWTTRRHFIDIAPGATARYRLVYTIDAAGRDAAEITPAIAWQQPGANPS